MPVNYLLIESLQRFHYYYGDDFKIECPTGSKKFVSINEAADEITRRLSRVFLKDETGTRPVLKYHDKLATDPHFRDYVLFHEYFHGDNGRGVGASHQTGWTGLIAKLLQPRVRTEAVEELKASVPDEVVPSVDIDAGMETDFVLPPPKPRGRTKKQKARES
jgi:hypothetical protein